jgi:hypothetical protein
VQDTPACSTVLFSITYICFSIDSKEGIIHKVNDSPTSKRFEVASIPFTCWLNSIGNNVLDPPASNINGFCTRDTTPL